MRRRADLDGRGWDVHGRGGPLLVLQAGLLKELGRSEANCRRGMAPGDDRVSGTGTGVSPQEQGRPSPEGRCMSAYGAGGRGFGAG